MNCPNCNYEPQINEFDYVLGAGRFFALPLEMKQEEPADSKYKPRREPMFGCPVCGTVFINMGYKK